MSVLSDFLRVLALKGVSVLGPALSRRTCQPCYLYIVFSSFINPMPYLVGQPTSRLSTCPENVGYCEMRLNSQKEALILLNGHIVVLDRGVHDKFNGTLGRMLSASSMRSVCFVSWLPPPR